jgi:hypothetical protein
MNRTTIIFQRKAKIYNEAIGYLKFLQQRQ